MDDELPPELRSRRQAIYEQVTQRGRARRSRRVGAVAFAVAAVVALPVGAVALTRESANQRVSTFEPSTTMSVPTSPSQTTRSETGNLTLANLADRLTRAGHRVSSDGTTSGYPFAKTTHLLCVDGTQMRVFEYADITALFNLERCQYGRLQAGTPSHGLRDPDRDHRRMGRTPTLLRERPHHRPRTARQRRATARLDVDSRTDDQPARAPPRHPQESVHERGGLTDPHPIRSP